MKKSFFEFNVKDSQSADYSLAQHKGKVVLVVNVASKCGFTPQYKGLEGVYQQFKNDPFIILGFPCNQFGAQEPGDENEIKQFCQLTYQVSFPMFKKVDVNGEQEAPLYTFLKNSLPGILGTKAIKWNFTKFLVNKNGIPVQRYAPTDSPLSIESDILELL